MNADPVRVSLTPPTALRWLACLFAGLGFGISLTAADCSPPRSTRYDGSSSARSEFKFRAGYDNSVAMTLEAWVYREDAAECETIVSHDYTQSWWFGFCPRLRFYRSGGTFADADVDVPAGQWTHVAASYDGKSVTFVINGQPAGIKALSHKGDSHPTPVIVGADPSGFHFHGLLDEIRLWSVARSPEEIESGRFLELRNTPGLSAIWDTGGDRDLVDNVSVTPGAGATPQVAGILPFIPGSPIPSIPIPLAGTPAPVEGPTLSGHVFQGNSPVPNVFLALEGPVRQVTLTDAAGHYAFACLPPGDYRVIPFKDGLDLAPAIAEVLKFASDRTVNFTAAAPQTPKPLVSSDKPSGTRIELDRRVYPLETQVHATLTLGHDSDATELHALIASTATGDVELLVLKNEPAFPRIYRTQTGLALTTDSSTPHDAQLGVKPGDRIAVLHYLTAASIGTDSDEQAVGDFALVRNPDFNGSPVVIEPGIAASSDELQPPPGGKPLGTLLARNGWPVQIPVNEVVFFPRDADDLKRFIDATAGSVKAVQGDLQSGESLSYLVQWTPPKADLPTLRQLRDLLDQKDEVFASNSETLDLWAGILELRLRGFIVASNPRLQFHDVPGVPPSESNDGDSRSRTFLNQGPLNVPQLWAFLALWDRDEVRIPAAILDVGFAPSPDLRTPLIECDMEAVGPGGMLCGPGRAFGFQRVGNSLFGARTWHGTGVASTLGGRLNNRWTPSDGQTGGRAGVGGQVVQPLLYQYGLGSYVFEFGAGMRKATVDGASVINISGGYPCRIADTLGIGFNICSPGGRAALCATATAVLATASAAICATAGLTAAIPFVGPIIAVPLFIACGAATAATVAGSAACFATLLLGDPRDPMIEGVRFATDRGVPIVVSAGNRLSSDVLPPIVRDLIDFNEVRIEQWQVFPAMIEPCIVAGATADNWPFNNLHFTGNRVNIWAPIRTSYYRPVPEDSLTPPNTWVREFIGGTSAAAPYAAGTIAAMQAVNPSLNPRTPGLSDAQRRAIPGRIRGILTNSAWSTAELAAMAPADQVAAVNAGAAQRRHLINPFRAVQTAAQGIIPDFATLGYDTRLDFNEVNPAEAADDPANARLLPLAVQQTATLINILGEDGAPDRQDVDWWQFTIPAGSDLRIGRVLLTYPRGFGDLTLDGLSLVRTEMLGAETRLTFDTAALFPGSNVRFAVRGIRRADNVYKLTLESLRLGGVAPGPDAFDRNDLVNPVRPDNNLRARAVPLGTTPALSWQPMPGDFLHEQRELVVNNLTFHDSTDADWFRIDAVPELQGCQPSLEIHFDRGVRCTVYGRTARSESEVIARSTASPVTLPKASQPGVPIFVLFENIDPTRPLRYKARFVYRALSPELCALADLANSRGASQGRDLFGSGFFPFPCPAPDSLTINPGDFLQLPGRDSDPFGRVINPEWNLIEWRGGGDFAARIQIPGNASLRVRLLQLDGTLLSEVATPDLGDAKAGPPDDFPGARTLSLRQPSLPPGTYIIEYSQGTLGILIGLSLPRNAIRDGSIALEDLAAGPLPTPPQLEAFASADPAKPLLNLQWPAGERFPRLEQASLIDPKATWSRAAIPLRFEKEFFSGSIPTGDGNRFFRLIADPDACFDAGGFDPGSHPNPWVIGGYEFTAVTVPGGAPSPEVLVRLQDGIPGIDVNSFLTVTLPEPANSVEVGFVSRSGLVTFAAYDASGTLVATETVAGTSPDIRTVTLRSAGTDIVWVDVHSPNLLTVLTHLCIRHSPLLPGGDLTDDCHDFRLDPVGPVPNPLELGGIKLSSWLRSDSAPLPDPSTRIETLSGETGYRVEYRTEIELGRPCSTVHIDFLQLAGLVDFEAFDSAGASIDWRRFTGVTGAPQSVHLGSPGAAIQRIVVLAPNNRTVLLRICCDGSAASPNSNGDCVAFPSASTPRPNPWHIGGLTIRQINPAGVPTPSVSMGERSGETGIDLIPGETSILLPMAMDEVTLRVAFEGDRIEIEAQDAGYRTVDRASVAGPGPVISTPTLRGSGIVRILIKPTNAKGILSEICR